MTDLTLITVGGVCSTLSCCGFTGVFGAFNSIITGGGDGVGVFASSISKACVGGTEVGVGTGRRIEKTSTIGSVEFTESCVRVTLIIFRAIKRVVTGRSYGVDVVTGSIRETGVGGTEVVVFTDGRISGAVDVVIVIVIVVVIVIIVIIWGRILWTAACSNRIGGISSSDDVCSEDGGVTRERSEGIGWEGEFL